MSAELEPLLRAALDADSPEWLDRLVVERVIASVRNEVPEASPARERALDGAVGRAGAALHRGWSRVVFTVESWLRERRSRAATLAELRAVARGAGRP